MLALPNELYNVKSVRVCVISELSLVSSIPVLGIINIKPLALIVSRGSTPRSMIMLAPNEKVYK